MSIISDQELLELAAKAARASGLNIGQWYDAKQAHHVDDESNGSEYWWVPLDDDGDALRLACALYFYIECNGENIIIYRSNILGGTEDMIEKPEDNGGCRMVAMRRCIVRAAAEIGRAMP
ncbi:hypothetical protein [Pseudomonas costantinii]|uniref:DUF2591 domain-containing protein n=1 Tax=Pseudomonas costantinii TaxID=168469 RepID=A0A1S2UEE8_9PSED|nr:hypothetical protein [Pseudomonas costantinii]OIN44530.1 hypothetical protein BFL40_30040 [Pseudomonas costantinii]SED26905.1 hypothetical protein SAMN04515675_0501 [Pseudomonas costantinii]